MYTRWGRTSCGKALKVYDGLAGGTHYSHHGGGANYVCLPHSPDYNSFENTPACSYMYGAEYQSYNKIFPVHNHDHGVPCAVCYQPYRGAQLMIPGKMHCPSGWSFEYNGYLMAEYLGHARRTQYACVDDNPESVPGSARNIDGALFYFVASTCHGLPCPPYQHNKPVTCVVCTK